MYSGSTIIPAYGFNSHGYLTYWQQETEKAEKVYFDIHQADQGHALL